MNQQRIIIIDVNIKAIERYVTVTLINISVLYVICKTN